VYGLDLQMTEASLRKPTVDSGRSQRCSSACMLCASLCVCCAGQCRRTCSAEPSDLLQWGQLASGARPILCLYLGMEVRCPLRSRDRWIRFVVFRFVQNCLYRFAQVVAISYWNCFLIKLLGLCETCKHAYDCLYALDLLPFSYQNLYVGLCRWQILHNAMGLIFLFDFYPTFYNNVKILNTVTGSGTESQPVGCGERSLPPSKYTNTSFYEKVDCQRHSGHVLNTLGISFDITIP